MESKLRKIHFDGVRDLCARLQTQKYNSLVHRKGNYSFQDLLIGDSFLTWMQNFNISSNACVQLPPNRYLFKIIAKFFPSLRKINLILSRISRFDRASLTHARSWSRKGCVVLQNEKDKIRCSFYKTGLMAVTSNLFDPDVCVIKLHLRRDI